jgi:uncharacterized Zn finger protein
MIVTECCSECDPDVTDEIISREPLVYRKVVTCHACGTVQKGGVIDREERRRRIASGEWRVEEVPGGSGWVRVVEA